MREMTEELDRPPTAMWRKSSWSGFNGNCIEVANFGTGRIGVRDAKNLGQGPVLVFSEWSWQQFLDSLKKGDLGKDLKKSDLDLAT
jgi:hypothetical protein